MKKIGVLLTARPEGGAFQYTQAILEAALDLPRDRYSLVVAYGDPSWLGVVRDRARAFPLRDSLWTRFLNRICHEAGLPVSA